MRLLEQARCMLDMQHELCGEAAGCLQAHV